MRLLLIVLIAFQLGADELHLIVPRATQQDPAALSDVRRALEQRQFEQARTLAQQLPDPASRRLWTAIAHLLAGDAYQAIRVLRARPPGPGSGAEAKVLAIAYSQAHQWLLFRQTMEAAAQLDPGDSSIHYALASYWNSQGADAAKAEALFREVLKLEPQHRLAHYYLGGLLERQNRMADAEAAYQASLRAAPNGLAWLGLARLRRAAGQEDEALKLARHAEALDPRNADVVRFLAKALNDRQAAEALQYWRRLTEIAPNDPANWYGLYRLFLTLGDRKAATEAQQRFDLVRRVYGNR